MSPAVLLGHREEFGTLNSGRCSAVPPVAEPPTRIGWQREGGSTRWGCPMSASIFARSNTSPADSSAEPRIEYPTDVATGNALSALPATERVYSGLHDHSRKTRWRCATANMFEHPPYPYSIPIIPRRRLTSQPLLRRGHTNRKRSNQINGLGGIESNPSNWVPPRPAFSGRQCHTVPGPDARRARVA